MPIKPLQLEKYYCDKSEGKFDAFVYVLTVTVRDHLDEVYLVGFAREDDIKKTVDLKKVDSYENYIIHFLELHPVKFLKPALYKTSKTLRDYVDE